MSSRSGIAIVALLAFAGCGGQSKPLSEAEISALRPAVIGFCADCHAYPQPETFPRDRWHDEIVQGFEFYKASGRRDLDVPSFESIVAYYQSQAPDSLQLPVPSAVVGTGPIRFEQEVVFHPTRISPAVSSLHWSPRQDGTGGDLLVCDVRNGNVGRIRFAEGAYEAASLVDVLNAVHVEPCDLDGDGHLDLLLSDLGDIQPTDALVGRVLVARRSGASDGYEILPLAENLPRVADARPADFDGDGDLDIVVAAFGWRRSGRLILLENVGTKPTELRFEEKTLDSRHGPSHVPVADLDGDGRMDFLALISQEHETIVAFQNTRKGRFQISPIFTASDPSYGSSGVRLHDIDGDGDLDVLYTNGDSFDSQMLKPYHSLQWLENRGRLKFVHHHIDYIPGAYAAAAADFDTDGDQDLVVCAMTRNYDLPFNTVLCFEQTGPGKFKRHNLDFSFGQHVALEVGDFNGDGKIDFAVGEFESRPVASEPWVSIWWNRGAAMPDLPPQHPRGAGDF